MINKQKCTALLFFVFFCFSSSAEYLSVGVDQSFLHEAPSDSTKKNFIVTKGYPLEVLVSLKEWKKVKDHQGAINWIQSNHLSTKKMALNFKDNNPIHLEPDKSSPTLAFVAENVLLEVLDNKKIDNWIKVYSKSTEVEGFISTESLWGIK
jgi:SH3 domain protein